MHLAEALSIAKEARDALAPWCTRCEIAGSIRRQCVEVGDVEIVCIPSPLDVFRFAAAVKTWTKTKGEPTGRYTQRRLPSGMILDLFMATPENWGLIYAIRTGSARFSREVLGRGWCAKGYVSRGGLLRLRGFHGVREEEGPPIPVREEADLFALIGLPWVAPEERT